MKEIYRSKKPDKTDLTAELVKRPNEGTVILKYLTGDEKGKSVTISTSTLKRYWRKEQAEDTTTEKSAEEILGIDMEEVNKPYKPDVTPHYIEKPESVKEYEENKRRKRHNVELPEFEDIVEKIGSISCKVNSNYVKLNDKATTVWRYSGFVACYATTDVAEKLSKAGLTSGPNKDKARPFSFIIKDVDSYNTLINTLVEYLGEEQ